MVVLHYTAMQSAEDARDRLCDPLYEVSAHYVVAEDGRLWQLVREADRAWHAGAGAWGACRDVNSHSIGIELANTGSAPFPEPQMVALEGLLSGILTRWSIPVERVVGHSDTALGRKIDPGVRFDWKRLARGGLAIWPEGSSSGEGRSFAHDFRVFGYDPEEHEVETVVNAVRMRFRPWASGPLDDTDRAIVAELAERWPVADYSNV